MHVLMCAAMQKPESEGIPFSVRLSFYELVNRAGFSTAYQDKVYWEVWKIQLKVVTGCQNSAGATCRIASLFTTLNSRSSLARFIPSKLPESCAVMHVRLFIVTLLTVSVHGEFVNIYCFSSLT